MASPSPPVLWKLPLSGHTAHGLPCCRLAPVANDPGCVKTRRRSIAIEQVTRSRPFHVPTSQAHSILKSKSRISFSSRIELLSFHTAWTHVGRLGCPLAGTCPLQASPATCRASVARYGQSREKQRVRGEPAGYELGEEPHALRLACLPLCEKPNRSVHVQVGARHPHQ
jgi:hypothetical protein